MADAVNRSAYPVWVDTVIRGVSRVADRGVLWTGIAVVLLATGRRRAAIRGIGSLVVASVIANVLGKTFVGGDRPMLDDVPLARRIRRRPTTPSFPSGHSASAAAFVAGAALESAGAGVAIAPIAAGVAYSRVHVGAHWASDVVGGVLLGIGVALGGAILFPARPRQVRAAAAPVVDLPALPDGGGLLILVNPASGRDAGRADPTPELQRRLPDAVVHRLAAGDDLAAVAAGHPDLRALGVYGGDGTVAAAAAVARRADLPLMVLPGGTFNHFARSIGVTTIPDAVDAVRAGHGRIVDVGELTFEAGEPITVLNTASIGIYPNFVTEREKYERRLGKPIAGAIAAIGVLALGDPIELSIEQQATRVWSIFVGIDRYGGGVAPLARSRLDDGVLDVRILHARGAANRTRGVAALTLGRRVATTIDRLPFRTGASVVESFEARDITVTVRTRHDHDPGFAHDGEASMSTPGGEVDGAFTSSIRVVPGGLRVYAPDGR